MPSNEKKRYTHIVVNDTSEHREICLDEIRGYWVATWYVDGVQYQKSFSVKKYGYDNAIKLAIKFKEKKGNELYKDKLAQIKSDSPTEFIHYSKIPELSPSKFKELSNKSELTDLEKLSIEKFKFQLSLMNNTNISVNNEEKIWHHF